MDGARSVLERENMRVSAEEYRQSSECSEGTRSEDEISVGCPSPVAAVSEEESRRSSGEEEADDYFKPLKKLKMMQIDKVSYGINENNKKKRPRPRRVTEEPNNGVKSFNIHDILNHRGPRDRDRSEEVILTARIVRPWDVEGAAACPRGLLPPPPLLYRLPHPQDHPGLYPDTCSSGRSSTSDSCTSPDLCPTSVPSPHRPPVHRKQQAGKSPNSSPLDALFQMTSKTFEELNGDPSQDGSGGALNLFNARQQPKKKRKSRTAFTNHQIFELEKRFLYQKYLSPADRDEIAAQLGLSNAQVITWFQNRRAKLKRDMEELKKDVETAKAYGMMGKNQQNSELTNNNDPRLQISASEV